MALNGIVMCRTQPEWLPRGDRAPLWVHALGPIREIVQGEVEVPRRDLVILNGTASQPGSPVQIQAS